MNSVQNKKNLIEIIKSEWRAIFAAFHFLTIIPSFSKSLFTAQELGKSVGYYPLIGGLIGLSLLVIDRLFSFLFPMSVVGTLLIAFWVAVSGGLHFDGFLDTCDGIFGGTNPEDRLNIMKDERIGAFALIGGILLICIKLTSLNDLSNFRDQALLLAPIISRWGMSIAIVGLPYGRLDGLGKDIKAYARKKEGIIATIFMLGFGILIAGLPGIFIIVVAFIFVMGSSRYIITKIPGLTGDCYGAINEMIEVLVLLGFLVVTRVM